MPRLTAPKNQDSQSQADPVSLVGPPAVVEQPVSEEIVIGKEEPKAPRAADPTPVVTTASNGDIVIK
jgi:hypothetical protein